MTEPQVVGQFDSDNRSPTSRRCSRRTPAECARCRLRGNCSSPEIVVRAASLGSEGFDPRQSTSGPPPVPDRRRPLPDPFTAR